MNEKIGLYIRGFLLGFRPSKMNALVQNYYLDY